jgi:hypothetical protein
VPAREIGRVTEASGELVIATARATLRAPLARLAGIYHETIPSRMARAAVAAQEREPATTA